MININYSLQELLDDPELLLDISDPCIYKIYCLVNGKSYIGYSKSLHARFHSNNQVLVGHLHKWKLAIPEYDFIKDYDIRYGIRVYGLSNFLVSILYIGPDAESKESEYVQMIPEEFTYNRNRSGKSGFESVMSDYWTMNNGISEVRVPTREHDLWLAHGWVDGRLLVMSDYHWVTDGVNVTRIHESKLTEFLIENPEYHSGIPDSMKPPRNEGKVFITDGYVTRMHDPNSALPDGFVLGKASSKWPRVYDASNPNKMLFSIYPNEILKYQNDSRYFVVPASGCSIEYHLDHPDEYPILT